MDVLLETYSKRNPIVALHNVKSPGGGLLKYDLGRDVPLRLEK